MSSFQGRDSEKDASNGPNLSEESMPSAHKLSFFSRFGDVVRKQKREQICVNMTLEKLKINEVALNKSIVDLKKQLTALGAQLRKKDEHLKTLTPNTPAWKSCLAEMKLDLDKEEGLRMRAKVLRERQSDALCFIWKIEDGIPLDNPLLNNAEKLLATLDGQTVDTEVNRRLQAKHAERLKLMVTASKASTLETYDRIVARRGETARKAPADEDFPAGSP